MEHSSYKIVISGLGGVGGYYGAMLARVAREYYPEVEVWFYTRGEHLKTIHREGLTVRTPARMFTVQPHGVTDDVMHLPEPDLLILATKSYDLERNIEQLRSCIGSHTHILPLLNGADITEQIRRILPDANVWHGCVYISARKSKPGNIDLESDTESFFFGTEQQMPSAQEEFLLELLTRSGVNATRPEDIRAVIREKFMMISATATATSYYNMSIGAALRLYPEEMKALRSELITLFECRGVVFAKDMEDSLLRKQIRMPADSTSSMHADFLRGAQTEVENLTGYVVRMAAESGISVPIYEKMYQALTQESYPPRI